MNTRRILLNGQPRRDCAVLVDDRDVFVWRLDQFRVDGTPQVRRLSLDRPVRVAPDVPSFGGGDEAEFRPATRREQADRLRRLHARAVLFATPMTLCSTQDIADVFGVGESEVRASRPTSARRIGRAWMAPFADWLGALHIDLNALADRTEATRRPAIREITAPTLRPLGGPTRTRGGR